MRIILMFTLFCLCCFQKGFTQDHNRGIENMQEKLSNLLVDEIEKNNFEYIYSYIEPVYLKAKKKIIVSQLTAFYNEYKLLYPGTRRSTSLSWPTGRNFFAVRYFDSTGTALEIDLSFKDNDINAKVISLEVVNRNTLKKQREESNKGPQLNYQGAALVIKYPYPATFQLRNCNKEMRTVTFNSQISSFANMAYGNSKLETNKVLRFSSDYTLDSDYVRKGVAGIRKSLPPNFFTMPKSESWYDNDPNEDSIWFIKIFANVIDKAGNIKIFSAYKIVFDGKDASLDEIRAYPHIRNIEFIFDKNKLLQLEKKLKTSIKTE